MNKRRQKHPEVVTLWRMTRATHEQFLALGRAAAEAQPYSPEYHEALDQLRSLPGYPGGHTPGEGNILQAVVVDTPQVTVH